MSRTTLLTICLLLGACTSTRSNEVLPSEETDTSHAVTLAVTANVGLLSLSIRNADDVSHSFATYVTVQRNEEEKWFNAGYLAANATRGNPGRYCEEIASCVVEASSPYVGSGSTVVRYANPGGIGSGRYRVLLAVDLRQVVVSDEFEIKGHAMVSDPSYSPLLTQASNDAR